ncbi:unnamed protein product [Linum trigynum]|uniref:RNase H type-1 domain-containing protein n=1 Tax=Linum trigynum TaxID=586398 RepID=A0AAV2GNR4_9ROSI
MEIGRICTSIRQKLAAGHNRSIQHVKRTANSAAHLMTECETHWNSPVVWVDRPPMILIDQLRLDDVPTISD